jgi:hypothetical protein
LATRLNDAQQQNAFTVLSLSVSPRSLKAASVNSGAKPALSPSKSTAMRRRSARARRAAARRLLVLVAFCAMTISRTRAPDPVIDPKGAAVLPGLRCVSDETPDITLCDAGASLR